MMRRLLTSLMLTSATAVPATKTAAATVPAKMTSAATKANGLAGPDPSWYCNDHLWCPDGFTCCPHVGDSVFTCAGEPFATCFMDGLHYCSESNPIVCDSHCCYADDVCRDGSCYVRSSLKDLNLSVPVASGRAREIQSVHTRRPKAERLGWFPSDWESGMLNTVMSRLHEDFLAVQADDWRSKASNKPGNCWVIGFPSDLEDCSLQEPWGDGCHGSSATITQDGPYTFYNTNPVFAPTNYDSIDWCNDDPEATQSYTHSYSITESQSISTTLSSTIKATVGMKSTTEAKVKIGIASGSESFEMSASVETDFSSSRTQKSSTSKQWTSSTQVQVKPRTHVFSSCWLQTGTFESPFDGRVKINSPVVWACSSPLDGPYTYIFTKDQNYWTAEGIEQIMENRFGFAKEDLQDLFGQKIGGTFKGIAGQKVQCSTHTRLLKHNETCPGRHHTEETVVV